MWDGFHIIISLLMFPAFSFICILRVFKKKHNNNNFWCTNEFEHGRKESWRKVKVKLKREPDGS